MIILPAILCGGSGTRLWPVSRVMSPKQLQPLLGDHSLICETAIRLSGHKACLPPLIISSAVYSDAIEAELRRKQLDITCMILEPMPRDTAAAAAVAAHWAHNYATGHKEDVVLLLLPSDHFISDIAEFHRTLDHMVLSAGRGLISTIGVLPTLPETGYGYIRQKDVPVEGTNSFLVEEFVEKPDLETAKLFLQSGQYSWNSGMFGFRPDVFLSELARLEPEIAQAAANAFGSSRYIAAPGEVPQQIFRHADFEAIPKKSIDFAVMEKTDKASVIRADFGWSDVGNWKALRDIWPMDSDGNAHHGETYQTACRDSLFYSAKGRLAVGLGLENIAVIDTEDVVLVCHLDRSQDVKALHSELLDKGFSSARYYPYQARFDRVKATAWANDWLWNKAMPFWTEYGNDKVYGGAFEAFTLSGHPFEDAEKRVRVQARQAYVFAQAALLGHAPSAEAMLSPLNFMLDKAYTGSGRFVHKLHRDGRVADDQTDLYDLAFILFSLAYTYAVTHDPLQKQIAQEIVALIRKEFRHPSGGYMEAIPKPDRPRRANPHMHLFEACLAWADLHQDDYFMSLADELVGFYSNHLCHNGLLREHFTDNLQLLGTDTDPALRALEPGHLVEWCWLLDWHARLSRTELHPSVPVMNAFADTYGVNEATGLVSDRLDTLGFRQADAGSRLWPQTEYIRWKLTRGTPADINVALEITGRFREKYLTVNGRENGLWIDQYGVRGDVLSTTTPTSSFYHIMTCFVSLGVSAFR